MTFFQIFNSFLAMYQVSPSLVAITKYCLIQIYPCQILTSENWTDVLNNILTNQSGQLQIAISAIFLSLWMLFSYFVLISMFIACLNENFTIAEELKHQQQMEAYLLPKTELTVSWLRNFNPYTFFTSTSKRIPLADSSQADLSDEKVMIPVSLILSNFIDTDSFFVGHSN